VIDYIEGFIIFKPISSKTN